LIKNSSPFFNLAQWSIVPLLLFIFTRLIRIESGKFYQGWYDPTYAYLFNGLTFATGSTDIGHTDHPGTPLQLFCGLIIRLMSLFRPGNSLVSDVLNHPETYLQGISLGLVLLSCASLYFLGFQIWNHTKNKVLAVFVQLAPLLSLKSVFFLPVVTTESLLLSLVIFMTAILVKPISEGTGISRNTQFIIAFISGLIMATKISAAPVLLLPFLLIRGWKRKGLFLLFSLLSFAFWIAPVWHKMGAFLTFIANLFTHTGKYGTGEPSWIDWPVFLVNLKEIIFKEWPFTLHLVLLLTGWIYPSVKRKSFQRGLLSVMTLTTLVAILVVARQHSFHYLIPVYSLMMPLQLLFWHQCLSLKNRVKLKSMQIKLIISVAIILVFTRLTVNYHFFPGLKPPVAQTRKLIHSELSGKYIVLTEGSNGTAFSGPAQHFGLAYTGTRKRPEYGKVLFSNEEIPYLWVPSYGLMLRNEPRMTAEPFARYPMIYLYNRSADVASARERIYRMVEESHLGENLSLEEVFDNPLSGEVIIRSINDTASIQKHFQPIEINHIGMEHVTKDGTKFFNENQTLVFAGAEWRSNETAFEGDFSVKLSRKNPYSLQHFFPAGPGDRFCFTVWQKTFSGELAHIVATSSNGTNQFCKTSLLTSFTDGQWHKTVLNIELPGNYPDSTLSVFLFYTGKDSVWADNLMVEKFLPIDR